MNGLDRRYAKYERRYANWLAGKHLGLSLDRRPAKIEGAAPYIVVSIVKFFRGLRKASKRVDTSRCALVDVGAGRGHALYFVHAYQRYFRFLRFSSLNGIELDPELYEEALQLHSDTEISLFCADALAFDLSRFGPDVVYFLNNPMSEDRRLQFIRKAREKTANPLFLMTNSEDLDLFCERAELDVIFMSNAEYKMCVAAPPPAKIMPEEPLSRPN